MFQATDPIYVQLADDAFSIVDASKFLFGALADSFAELMRHASCIPGIPFHRSSLLHTTS